MLIHMELTWMPSPGEENRGGAGRGEESSDEEEEEMEYFGAGVMKMLDKNSNELPATE